MSESIEIIAEIGVNHNGDIGIARELIRRAKHAGCDTVKFQLWSAERSWPSDPQMAKLELKASDMAQLMDCARNIGIRFLCTPDDEIDACALHTMGVERFKIGSSNVTNLPLLDKIASYGKPVILSTGACTYHEMREAICTFPSRKLTIMHCVSTYPAYMRDLNLLSIRVLRRDFGRSAVGFSDHTSGDSAALIALGLGARVFEKHFTLKSSGDGPDHHMSLEPEEMADYVRDLREGAAALGESFKQVLPCEQDNREGYLAFVRRQKGAGYADGVAAR